MFAERVNSTLRAIPKLNVSLSVDRENYFNGSIVVESKERVARRPRGISLYDGSCPRKPRINSSVKRRS